MADTLQKYFESRETRMLRLPDGARQTFEQRASVEEDPQVYLDSVFVNAWAAKRLGVEREVMRRMLDQYIQQHLGTDSYSVAYDQIAALYAKYPEPVVQAAPDPTPDPQAAVSGMEGVMAGVLRGAVGIENRANLNALMTTVGEKRRELELGRMGLAEDTVSLRPATLGGGTGERVRRVTAMGTGDARLPGAMDDAELRQRVLDDPKVREAEALYLGTLNYLENVPQSAALTTWQEEQDVGAAAVKVWRKHGLPGVFQVMGDIAGEGAGGSWPQMALTLTASLSGSVPVTMAAAFAGGVKPAYDQKLQEKLAERGELSDAEAVLAVLEDPDFMAEAQAVAARYGLTLASFDAATLGLTSKLGGADAGLKRTVAALVLETASEPAGEATAQLAAEGKVDAKSVVEEAIGGAPGAAIDTAAALNAARRKVLRYRDGNPLTPKDFERVRDTVTPEQIRDKVDPELADVLIAATEGDKQAQDAYNAALVEKKVAEQYVAEQEGQSDLASFEDLTDAEKASVEQALAEGAPLADEGVPAETLPTEGGEVDSTVDNAPPDAGSTPATSTVEELPAMGAEEAAALITPLPDRVKVDDVLSPAAKRLIQDELDKEQGLQGLSPERVAYLRGRDREWMAGRQSNERLREAYKQKLAQVRVRNKAREAKLRGDFREKAAAIRRAHRENRADLTQSVRSLEEIVRYLPRAIRGDFKGFGTLTNIQTKDAQQRYLARAAERIVRLAESYERRLVRDRVLKRVNRLRKQMAQALRKGKKLPYDGDAMAAYLGGISTASQSELAKLAEKVAAIDPIEGEPTVEQQAALAELAKPKLNDPEIGIEELLQVEDELTALEANERSQMQQKRDREAAEAQAAAGSIALEVGKANDQRGRALDDDTPSDIERATRVLRQGGASFLSAETIASMAVGGDVRTDRSTLYRSIVKPMMAAAGQVQRARMEFQDRVRKWTERSELDVRSASGMRVTEIGGRVVRGAEAMLIYAYSQNERGQAHLNSTRWGSTRLTEDAVGMVVEAMPQELKDFVDLVIDHLDAAQYPRVNAWFKDKYGYSLPKEERYFPIVSLDRASFEANLFNDYKDLILFKKGFAKARTGDVSGFRTEDFDFFSLLTRHVMNVEHVIAHEPVITRANRILMNEAVAKEMNRFSRVRFGELQDWLKRNADGRMGGAQDSPITKAMDFLRRNTSIALVGLNLNSTLKTASSFFVARRYVRAGELAMAIKQFARNPMEAIRFADENSPDFVRNYDQFFNREFAELLKDSATRRLFGGTGLVGGGMALRDKFIDAAYWPMRIVTKAQVALFWNAKYQEAVNDALASGMAPDRAHADGVDRADRMVRLAFPSGRLVDMPKAFAQSGLERLFTTFTTDQNKAGNLLAIDLGKEPSRGKLRKVRDMSFAASALFIMPAIWLALMDAGHDTLREAVGLAEEKDEEERKKAFAADVARYTAGNFMWGIFPVAQIAEATAARVAGDPQGAYFASDLSPMFFAAPEALAKGELLEAALLGLGAPGSPYLLAYLRQLEKEEEASRREYRKLMRELGIELPPEE